MSSAIWKPYQYTPVLDDPVAEAARDKTADWRTVRITEGTVNNIHPVGVGEDPNEDEAAEDEVLEADEVEDLENYSDDSDTVAVHKNIVLEENVTTHFWIHCTISTAFNAEEGTVTAVKIESGQDWWPHYPDNPAFDSQTLTPSDTFYLELYSITTGVDSPSNDDAYHLLTLPTEWHKNNFWVDKVSGEVDTWFGCFCTSGEGVDGGVSDHGCRPGVEVPCPPDNSSPTCDICSNLPCGIVLTISSCPITRYNGVHFLEFRDGEAWPYISCLFWKKDDHLVLSNEGGGVSISGSGPVFLCFRENVEQGDPPVMDKFWHVQIRTYVDDNLTAVFDCGCHSLALEDQDANHTLGCCQRASGIVSGNGAPTECQVEPCCGCCGSCTIGVTSQPALGGGDGWPGGITNSGPVGGAVAYQAFYSLIDGKCDYLSYVCDTCYGQSNCPDDEHPYGMGLPMFASVQVDLGTRRVSVTISGVACNEGGCRDIFCGGGDLSSDGSGAACEGGACGEGCGTSVCEGGVVQVSFSPGCGPA